VRHDLHKSSDAFVFVYVLRPDGQRANMGFWRRYVRANGGTGDMSVFLFVLGIASALAGVVLLAPSAIVHRAFTDAHLIDGQMLTPGAIAIVGGLVLIGIALAVRQLRRIEKALAVREMPMPRAVQAAEIAAAVRATLDAVPRVPLPAKPQPKEPAAPPAAPLASSTPPPPSAAQATGPPLAASESRPGAVEEVALQRLRAKLPGLVRLDNAAAGETADIALMPRTPMMVEHPASETTGVAAPRPNGSAPPRAMPRVEGKVQTPPLPKANAPNLNAFWPAAPRRAGSQSAPPAMAGAVGPGVVAKAAAAAPAVAPGQAGQMRVEAKPAAASPASGAVTVLKSGVVEGMAYKLYSDGSIEAELPRGTVRFSSIADLRNHLEGGTG
jgi:hypothetical protein